VTGPAAWCFTGPVLGWNISVYRLRDGSAAGDRLAVWQSGSDGLRWLDQLVESGAAIATSTGGYPSVFFARARDVLARLGSPPEARETWIAGPDDMRLEKWAGRTVTDPGVIAVCAPDEWLLIKAWDES
jgi:hypothetical protein